MMIPTPHINALPTPLLITCDVLERLNDINLLDCNGHFQHHVCQAIFATGKHVDDLTLGELRAIVEQQRATFVAAES